MSLQFHRVHVNHHLPVLAPKRRRNRRAGNARNLVSNLILQIVVQLGFVQSFARHRQQTHRQTGGIHLQHNGRQRSLREPSQIRHSQVGNLRDVRIGIRTGLEINLDQAHPGQRPRFHMIHAARQREEAFKRIGDIRFDLLGRHPAIKRRHQNDRNLDGRKHVHRHARQAGQPQHGDE